MTGSLGTSVFDMEAYLVGASGGVYALLAAHLANIVLVSFINRLLTNIVFDLFKHISLTLTVFFVCLKNIVDIFCMETY